MILQSLKVSTAALVVLAASGLGSQPAVAQAPAGQAPAKPAASAPASQVPKEFLSKPPSITRKILDSKDVGDYTLSMAVVDVPVGGREGRHRHEGILIGLVEEGVLSMDHEPTGVRDYKPGETFYIPEGQIHEGLQQRYGADEGRRQLRHQEGPADGGSDAAALAHSAPCRRFARCVPPAPGSNVGACPADDDSSNRSDGRAASRLRRRSCAAWAAVGRCRPGKVHSSPWVSHQAIPRRTRSSSGHDWRPTRSTVGAWAPIQSRCRGRLPQIRRWATSSVWGT